MSASGWYALLDAVRRARPRIDLSTGEPITTPALQELVSESLRAAAARADAVQLVGRYHHHDGWPELRERIAAWASEQAGTTFEAEQVLVCAGAQAALRLVQRLVRSRKQRIGLAAGLDFVGLVDPEGPAPVLGGFGWGERGQALLRHDRLEWGELGVAALSHPHNPTGTTWADDDLGALLEAGARSNAWVLVDRTYAPPLCALTRDVIVLPAHPSSITVTSFSKVGLAAARVGVLLAGKELVHELAGLQREQLIMPPMLGQLVAAEWMDRMARRPEIVHELVDAWARRWAAMAESLATVPGVMLARWGGGPFLWCEWRGRSDELVAADLLAEGIAVTPASALCSGLGREGQALRIGLGAAPELLREAGHAVARRLRAAV